MPHETTPDTHHKRIVWRRVVTSLVVFAMGAMVLLLTFLYIRYQISPRIIVEFMSASAHSLKQANGQTNILLLGIGGNGHEGSDLTDTIIVVSLGTDIDNIVFLSLPRDIWVPTFKDKLNAAYHYGEEKKKGGGFILAKAAVEEITGIPIHYAVLLDFGGFKKIVDVVGGIDVEVAETFTDSLYPITGRENDLCNGDPEYACRYETVTFNQGKEHMDGERALKYVRSRYAQGDAGTDFSRGRRQQAVLVALKNKVMTTTFLTNISGVRLFLDAVASATTTDVSTRELFLISRLFQHNSDEIKTITLTQEDTLKGTQGLLINPPLWEYDGRWVLIPKHNDFAQIHTYIRCHLENQVDCEALIK